MTAFFDRHRFGRLLRAHLAEHRRDYFWFVVVAVIVDIVYMAIAFKIDLDGPRQFSEFQFPGQGTRYGVGLFITSFIFCGRYFRDLQQPGPALITFMRPASIFEKFALTFLMTGIAFPVTFALFSALLNYPVAELASFLYVPPKVCPGCAALPPPDFAIYVPIRELFHGAAAQHSHWSPLSGEIVAYLTLWTMQGIVLGATVFFKRAGLLWMFLICFVLAIVLSALNIEPHMEVFFQAQNFGDNIGYNNLQKCLSFLVWGGIPVLTWLALYFHIKEREVA